MLKTLKIAGILAEPAFIVNAVFSVNIRKWLNSFHERWSQPEAKVGPVIVIPFEEGVGGSLAVSKNSNSIAHRAQAFAAHGAIESLNRACSFFL